MAGLQGTKLDNNLNPPNQIPKIGLGIGSLTPTPRETVSAAIHVALERGYRLFDTAYVYRNEDVLGDVLKVWMDQGRIKREELFIITKLPPIGMEKSMVEHFLKLSLAALKLDYVDLYLVHFPLGCPYTGDDNAIFPTQDGKFLIDKSTSLEGVWEGMEAQVLAGRAKTIGMSNFTQNQVQRIINVAKIRPRTVQLETHIYIQQKGMREFCAKNNITFCAYAPLGSPGRRIILKKSGSVDCPFLLEDTTVVQIAKANGKTPAQVLLRFLIQNGLTVIPNSVNPQRIRENIQVSDFVLSVKEMEMLESIDKGEDGRMFTMRNFIGFEEHPEFPFK